ncbi:MAG: hypothetical protein KC457_08720, partial [Myxococcales bacterium]|nr:hypothetical protein [Myxococcales bacterium]
SPAPEDSQSYALSLLDYGCGPCKCPQADVASPWISFDEAALEVGAQLELLPPLLDTLSLTKMSHSVEELEARAAVLLEFVGVDSPPGPLEPWAKQALQPGVGLHPWTPTAGVTLMYAAEDDDLLVINERASVDDSPVLDRDDAQGEFLKIIWALQAKGLAPAIDTTQIGVGEMSTEVGESGLATERRIDGWLFTAHTAHAGFPLLNSGVSAFIGRGARVSAIRLFDVSLDVGSQVSPRDDQALLAQRWSDGLASHSGTAQYIFIDSTQWSYLLEPGKDHDDVEPRLIVRYVLGHEHDGDIMPSRQFILALSPLIEAELAFPFP